MKVAKTPALAFFDNTTTEKLDVWGDKFSVENDMELMTKADSILSHSVASGHEFVFADVKTSNESDGFTGKRAYLQYDIMKACYLHYMSSEQIEEYLESSCFQEVEQPDISNSSESAIVLDLKKRKLLLS